MTYTNYSYLNNCSNCNKELMPSEKEFCERTNTTECAECVYHALNGTRTIEKYNEWLKNK